MSDDCRIIDELINELGPNDEPGFWHLDSGNLQWFAGEAHKRLTAAKWRDAAAAQAPAISGKVKLTEPGQPCRHCGTPVVWKEHSKPPKYKAGSYYYSRWLSCRKCSAAYYDDSDKVMFDAPGTLPFQPAAPVSSHDPEQIGDGLPPW